MKILKSILPIALVLFFCLPITAQNKTEFTTKRNLGFKESSKIQQVELKIAKNTEGLRLNILCNVKKGDVSILIFSPSGEEHGEFSVEGADETEDDGSLFSMLQQGVSGEINKDINQPEKGVWVIKFVPKNATGRVEINSSQFMR